MEVKINREIRNYTESMFFGLSLRQFIFSVLACGVAVSAVQISEQSRSPLLTVAVWAKQGIGVYKDEEDYVAEPLPEEENPNARKTGSTLYNSIVQRVGSLMSTQTRSGKATAVVEGVADKFDILGLNYGHCRYDMEVSNHPDRILLGTEDRKSVV